MILVCKNFKVHGRFLMAMASSAAGCSFSLMMSDFAGGNIIFSVAR